MPLSDTTVLALRDAFNVISASGEVVEVLDRAVVANSFPGADIGAKVNNAIASLGVNGGDVYILAGTYEFSTTIDMGDRNNIRIIGQGGVAGANNGLNLSATHLNYTGSGTAIQIGDGVGFAYGAELHQFGLKLEEASAIGVYVDKHIYGVLGHVSINNQWDQVQGVGFRTAGVDDNYGWQFNHVRTNYLDIGLDLVDCWGAQLYNPWAHFNDIGIKITLGHGTFFHGADIEENVVAGLDIISGQKITVEGAYFESGSPAGSRCIRIGSGAATPEAVSIIGGRITKNGSATHAIELAKVRGFQCHGNYFGDFVSGAILNDNAGAGAELEYSGNTVHGDLPEFISSYVGTIDGYDPVNSIRLITDLPSGATAPAGIPSGALWRDTDDNTVKVK
jgi:hypothetical protein